MNDKDLLITLYDAFCKGKTSNLLNHLSDNCTYTSDYACITVSTPEKIIERMKLVYTNQKANNCIPTLKIINLKQLISHSKLTKTSKTHLCEYDYFLFHDDSVKPVAVVYIEISRHNKIENIVVSRDTKIFSIDFAEDELKDSPNDLPLTADPLVLENMQKNTYQNDKEEYYIWIKADEYIKNWLEINDYSLLRSEIFDDCIGYRLLRNNCVYTLYMFAYGQKKTTQLDGNYCNNLRCNKLSEKSSILVVYLHIKRFKNGDEFQYDISDYNNSYENLELWQLIQVDNRPILLLLTTQTEKLIDKLIYAFNQNSKDVYDCIIHYSNSKFTEFKDSGNSYNDLFFTSLKSIRDKYGKMKIGYLRFNDVIYRRVSYIDGYGFFSLTINNISHRIQEITAFPFSDNNQKIGEFIKTDIGEDKNLYNNIPKLVEIKPLKPIHTEQFAMHLKFDNAEYRKYVLPSYLNRQENEVMKYNDYVFTDKIWQSGEIVPSYFEKNSVFQLRNAGIRFKNGFFISETQCYEESTPYKEPIICKDVRRQERQM